MHVKLFKGNRLINQLDNKRMEIVLAPQSQKLFILMVVGDGNVLGCGWLLVVVDVQLIEMLQDFATYNFQFVYKTVLQAGEYLAATNTLPRFWSLHG